MRRDRLQNHDAVYAGRTVEVGQRLFDFSLLNSVGQLYGMKFDTDAVTGFLDSTGVASTGIVVPHPQRSQRRQDAGTGTQGSKILLQTFAQLFRQRSSVQPLGTHSATSNVVSIAA